MKEKIKNLSNKKIVITSLCAFAIILLLGLTYAYWTRTFSQTGENISTYDCFDITFSENVEGISMENGYPITDEEGLKTESYEVTITNTCKTVASYNVILNKLNTSTLDDSHVKVAVNKSIKLLNETENTSSSIENAIEGKIINTGVLLGKDSKKIQIQQWMDENTSEEEGANKTFAYKITIEAIAKNNDKLLASKILSESLQTSKPEFSKTVPRTIKFESTTEKTKELEEPLSSANYWGVNKYVSNEFEYNDTAGRYILINSTRKKYDDSTIGMYTCDDGQYTSCDTLYKINEVNVENPDEYHISSKLIAGNFKFPDIGEGITIGKNYELNTNTGDFTLTDTINITSISEDLVGYYYCSDKSTSCKYPQQIYKIENGKVTSSSSFAAHKNVSYVVNADVYNSKEIDSKSATNGLYKTEDDDGNSYYFRGNPENNYVDFANKSWRIMRINGDGTIRMILRGSTLKSAYSDKFNEDTYFEDINNQKYVGYTYENNHICTKENPCYKESGVNSTVKEYLETWYEDNLKNYDEKIAISNYCNDTSLVEQEYGASVRVKNHQPSLECPNTSQNYGGFYKLKIGLPTADEVNLAGYTYYNDGSSYGNSEINRNYIYKYGAYLMSPAFYDEYVLFTLNITDKIGCSTYLNNSAFVQPVINLRADTIITSGEGTKDNPYVIE